MSVVQGPVHIVPTIMWEGHCDTLRRWSEVDHVMREDWAFVAAAFVEAFDPGRADEEGHLAYCAAVAFKAAKARVFA